MKAWNKSLAALLCLGIAVASTGCGNGSGTGQQAKGSEKKDEKPMTIRIYTEWADETYPVEDNPYWLQMEKELNVDLKFEFNPISTYPDKLNVLMASGDLPDLISIYYPTVKNFPNWARQGAFQPVDKLLEKYAPEFMKSAQKAQFATSTIDGKVYGIFKPRALLPTAITYRKDILDKLNLKEPATTDELYNVLKAIKDSDVDGNGKKDTIPFTGSASANSLSMEMLFYPFLGQGTQNDWATIDGKLVYNGLRMKEMKEALAYVQKLYKEGLIDPDYFTQKSTQVDEKVRTGRAAFYMGALVNGIKGHQAYHPTLEKTVPGYQLETLVRPFKTAAAGPEAKGYFGPGHKGFFAIPSKIKDEARLKKIMEVLNYFSTDKGKKLLANGVEGFKDKSDYRLPTWDAITLPDYPKEGSEKFTAKQKEAEKFYIADPLMGISTPTFDEKMPDIQKIQTSIMAKIIANNEPVDNYDKFLTEWKTRGGDDITKSVNEEFAKSKK